jgi:5'-nucleotidase
MDPMKKLSKLSEKSTELSKFIHTITIFHTNDLHNHVQPFRHENLHGGLESIHARLKQINTPAVLVDAGDFLDGNASPSAHKKLIEKMNNMRYDAVTLGNKDLQQGQEYLFQLSSLMKFPLVNCNYTFSHDKLAQRVATFHIIKWGSYNIGITGVGPQLPESVRKEGMNFHHPYKKANETARKLKQHCDLVICLSHLGLDKQSRFNNLSLAEMSKDIDVIISGHEEKILRTPLVLRNHTRKEVVVSHGGWGGLMTRQLSITFNTNGERCSFASRNFVTAGG